MFSLNNIEKTKQTIRQTKKNKNNKYFRGMDQISKPWFGPKFLWKFCFFVFLGCSNGVFWFFCSVTFGFFGFFGCSLSFLGFFNVV